MQQCVDHMQKHNELYCMHCKIPTVPIGDVNESSVCGSYMDQLVHDEPLNSLGKFIPIMNECEWTNILAI